MIIFLFFLGLCLVLTPVYIIGQKPALTSKNVGSAMFCYVIGNQYLVFTLGIVSLYTVTLLAVERWCAVFRPFEHRTTFRIHKVRQYLIIIWIASFATNSTHILETKYFLNNVNTTERCHRSCRDFLKISDTIFNSRGVFHSPLSFHEGFTCCCNDSSKQLHCPYTCHTYGCRNIVGDGVVLVSQPTCLFTIQARCCAAEYPIS